MESYRRITRRDRYQIQKFLAAGKSVKWISEQLGFHRSSIYREKKRGTVLRNVAHNIVPMGDYSALKAHKDCLSHKLDRLGCFHQGTKIKGWIEDQIRIKLKEGWSPEQIAQRLKLEKNFSLSAEAIYKFILSCKRRGENLYYYLRRHGRSRKRFRRRSRYWDFQYKRRKSIDDRPIEANLRIEAGHFERDLMLGKRGSGAILTIVDRKNQYTLLEKVRSTFASEVNEATSRALKRSSEKVITITNDNGHEFGEFWNLEEALNAKVYFTHPLCPWERGSVENTIGLLRQFAPKGADLNLLSERKIKCIEKVLNSRPRKSLGFKTPLEIVTGKNQRLLSKKSCHQFTK